MLERIRAWVHERTAPPPPTERKCRRCGVVVTLPHWCGLEGWDR